MFHGYRAERKGGCYTFLVGNIHSQGCFSCTVKLKKGEGVCAETGETAMCGKQCKVSLQASVFMLLLEVIDSSGFHIILYTWYWIHFWISIIKKSMPEEKLFKNFLKQYWPYLITVTFSFFTCSFYSLFHFDLCGIFYTAFSSLLFIKCIIPAMSSAENKVVQSPVILSHEGLFVT